MDKKGYLLSARKLDSLDERLKQVKTVDQLPKEGCLLVIFDFDQDVTCDTLIQLRRTPAYRYTGFYAWDDIPEACEALIDSGFDEQAYGQAKQINERIAVCEKNDGAHIE